VAHNETTHITPKGAQPSLKSDLTLCVELMDMRANKVDTKDKENSTPKTRANAALAALGTSARHKGGGCEQTAEGERGGGPPKRQVPPPEWLAGGAAAMTDSM
jgi:hypothetical protein